MVEINIDDDTLIEFELKLESYDQNSSVQSTLKTDVIKFILIQIHFSSELSPQDLYIGEPTEWNLPEIVEGAFNLIEVIIKPDDSIKLTIQYLQEENMLKFDG